MSYSHENPDDGGRGPLVHRFRCAFALALLLPWASATWAQMCNPFTEPSTVSEKAPSAKWTQTFCDGNIAGTEACGGVTGKVEFFLELESMDDVDLNCTTDNGTICVMDASCSNLLAGGGGDALRLSGPLPGSSLRIIVSDDSAGTLCDQAMDPNVTCTGSFGGRIIIDTDFERSFENQGWSLDQCPDCLPLQGTLFAGGRFHSEPTLVGAPGTQQLAVLEAAAGADLDLQLARWDGSQWVVEVSGTGFGALEVVSWRGPSGTYRWQVTAAAGEADFTLWISPVREVLDE